MTGAEILEAMRRAGWENRRLTPAEVINLQLYQVVQVWDGFQVREGMVEKVLVEAMPNVTRVEIHVRLNGTTFVLVFPASGQLDGPGPLVVRYTLVTKAEA